MWHIMAHVAHNDYHHRMITNKTHVTHYHRALTSQVVATVCSKLPSLFEGKPIMPAWQTACKTTPCPMKWLGKIDTFHIHLAQLSSSVVRKARAMLLRPDRRPSYNEAALTS